MHQEGQGRLEAKLNDDSYTFATFCEELPYQLWNTCPLCVCGLLPVLVVCISAICRLDYATHVTDIGAQIINKMGLSYTVYYTAGCWPQDPASQSYQPLRPGLQMPVQPCNEAQFEIAAGEFDALSGSLLRVRNVTAVHAKRLVAVKVTPDWRFVTFIGSLAENDIGNLYAVDARAELAKEAVPLLTAEQLQALNAQCELHSGSVIAAQQAASTRGGAEFTKNAAILTGFRQLQIIIPGVPPLEFGGDFMSLPLPELGSSLAYRAAFSMVCKQPEGSGGRPVEFSKIAVLDFIIRGMNISNPKQPGRSFAWAESELRLVDTRPQPPRGANSFATEAVKRFHSQSCPRFVPSKEGSELIYVAEDVAPAKKSPIKSVWHEPTVLPPRLVALVQLPGSSRRLGVDRLRVPDDRESMGTENSSRTSISSSFQAKEKVLIGGAAQALTADSQILDIGRDHLPLAPISGCPEFVSDLYKHTQSFTQTVHDNLFKSPAEKAKELANEALYKDTFVALSDPRSSSILDVDAQVFSASLPNSSIPGEVVGVRLLYNVGSTSGAGGIERLMLAGCQPIRAAGRQGHMRMQNALETVMETLGKAPETREYTAWLACLTADQRVAIVESPRRKHWINMSMPFPMWTGTPNQAVWCPREYQESCFEVWSNPNPNT